MTKYPSISTFREIAGRVPTPPAVSILLPFHPVVSSTVELEHRIKIALENVGHQLHKDYTSDVALSVMDRLEKLVQQLNYKTKSKSIALFASPHTSKLVYLESPVDEKITISEYFSLRGLIVDSKQLREYLVLVLSEKQCRFLLVEEDRITRVMTDKPTEAWAYVNENPERVANFTDPGDRNEIVMDKFLHNMDQELSHVLALHPLPLFVLGPEKVVGHFKGHSRHVAQIAGYVHGSYVNVRGPELPGLVQPCLEAWRQQNRRTILHVLETAANEKRVSTGIQEAWAAASHNNGRLLVVEDNYHFSARRGDAADQILPENAPGENPFWIKDAVDALISQVISQNGKIEFVNDGALKDYEHIALIRYH
jgi:hypothetical protein